jgi:hypothetical protein
MGALPLMLWAGAGAGSRKTIGAVIFTGAIFATLLTLFVVPVFYNLLARFTKSPEWTARQIEEYEARERTGRGKPHPSEPGEEAWLKPSWRRSGRSLRSLRRIEERILWLAAWTIHNANHLRESRDGLKVGGTRRPAPR